jgi:hypothetical protein
VRRRKRLRDEEEGLLEDGPSVRTRPFFALFSIMVGRLNSEINQSRILNFERIIFYYSTMVSLIISFQ